jgi:hypothetical protein
VTLAYDGDANRLFQTPTPLHSGRYHTTTTGTPFPLAARNVYQFEDNLIPVGYFLDDRNPTGYVQVLDAIQSPFVTWR